MAKMTKIEIILVRPFGGYIDVDERDIRWAIEDLTDSIARVKVGREKELPGEWTDDHTLNKMSSGYDVYEQFYEGTELTKN